MKTRRRSSQLYENVEILGVVAEGKTIAKVDDLVIFVTGAIPGDVVDLKVVKRKDNYREAIPVKFHKYSDKRISADCQHFGTCGGCKWQNLKYEDQLDYKQTQVVDALERIGKVKLPKINKILPSEKTFYYRNKLEFTFSNIRWFTKEEAEIENKNPLGLGFHIPGMFDKVVDIQKCYLQKDPSNEIRDAIRYFAMDRNYTFYDHREKTGFLRNIVVRTSTTNDLMIIVIFGYEDVQKRTDLLEFLAAKFPVISSLMYIINKKLNDSYTDLEPLLFKGKDHIYEQMGKLKFKIGAKSFYQTNSEQAFNLYKVTEEFAALTGNEIVYDLYTGTGTIANFIASKAKKVIGIEYIPEAIEDAKINSKINNIQNTEFFAGDLKDFFSRHFIRKNGEPDVVILDPPRAGVHGSVLDSLLFALPKRIVYVSCNPATQARDINILSKNYDVKRIQPVDMFPHTHHVENVVLLEKRDLGYNVLE